MRARATACPADERGSASVEMVVLLPMLLLILFTGIQGALFFHARTLAIAAASEGARAASVELGTSGAGVAAAQAFLADTAGDSLTGAVVTASRTATTATVRVQGVSLSVVPGWHPVVDQSASLPAERITR